MDREQLEDGYYLYDYDIQKESTLHLMRGMQIFVKIPTDKKITLEVDSCYTIYDVKAKNAEKQGILLSEQRLMIRGSDLNDECTLSYYKIQNKSCFQLVKQMKTSVKTLKDIEFELVLKLLIIKKIYSK